MGHAFLGVKLDNGSFTGALGDIQANRADLFLSGEPNGIVEPWLMSSSAYQSENIVIGQPINKQEPFKVFDLSRNFVEFSFEIILCYAVAVVGIVVFSWFLSRFYRNTPTTQRISSPVISRRRESCQRNLIRSPESNVNRFLTFLLKNRLTSFQLLSLCVNLFLWQTLLFFSSNTKTNKVVLG